MADNIKIVGQILNTDIVNRYTLQDEKLLIPTLQQETFGQKNDYIEYFVFDKGGELLNSDYNYKSYQLPYNSAYSQSLLPDIQIDPIQDIQDLGYQSGEVSVRYNFLRKISGEPFSNQLFIQQISTDRTEIRVNSTVLSPEQLLSITTDFINKQNSVPYYYYLVLNFGNNVQAIVVNVLSNITEGGESSILFKLYEPLPSGIQLKDTFWIVEEIINPYLFDLNLDKLITPDSQPSLRGPNFGIDLQITNTVPTSYNNYNQLVSSLTGSYYQAVLNSLANQGVDLNVDYSSLSEFVHYSSAQNRLQNFIVKIGEIDLYQQEISIGTTLTASNASLKDSVDRASSSINNIISAFDGFESYLYFNSSSMSSSIKEYKLESGSYSEYLIAPFPKTNQTQPYRLFASASATAQKWYYTASYVASTYDRDNSDILLNVIPSYITDDPGNYFQYTTFINMVGQYFDNVWVYIDRITDVWDNNNNLEQGISKDLIYEWLESFGVKLYNSFGDQNVLHYNVGNLSGSVNFNGDYSPSSSFLNNIPRKELTLDLYKRIYHNLPYLFKSKGSHGGLQALINIFGITGSILPVKEYGGIVDSGELLGYNPEKISLGSNNITGSILSSIKRFETNPTSSRDQKSQDLHFVDVSFSPQTQIDKAISASIASSNPSWILDDFIGDPTYLSMTTYPSLSFERDYYFKNTFSHSFDYGGFIRLIQFFDNSLFKMVKDFSPARGNTWTGVSIKSPVLERPKVAQFPPTFVKETEYQALYESKSITPVYDPYYYSLEGDKRAYYDGNISGAFVNTYAEFEERNINPFLVHNTVGYTPPGFVSGSTDFILDPNSKFFENSDFDVLQNNVNENLTSNYWKKIVPILSVDNLGRCFTSHSVTESVQLQDSYLSSTAYLNPRYNGVRMFGKLFNTWSFGDDSYGQSPVIEYNTKKLGLFTEVTNNVFFPSKSNINLKYLVDETGKLTELNKRNRNWVEVQNTFKTGNTLNISQFNSQKFSNQKFTDGNKVIHESGYSYSPVFYLYGQDSSVSSSSVPYINWITQSAFTAPDGSSQNVLDRYFTVNTITGSLIPSSNFVSSSYGATKWEFWNLFNLTGSLSSVGNYFRSGSGPGVIPDVTSSYYIIPEKANYQFNYNFDVTVNASASAGQVKWITGSMELWLSSSVNGTFASLSRNEIPALFGGQSYRANIGAVSTGYTSVQATWDGTSTYTIMNGYTVNEYNSSYDTSPVNTFVSPEVTYKLYHFTADTGPSIGNLNDQTDTFSNYSPQISSLGYFWVASYDEANIANNYPNVKLYVSIDKNSTVNNSDQVIKFRETVNVDPAQIAVGDKIAFRFFIDNAGTEIISAHLDSTGSLNVKPSYGSVIADKIHVCFDQQKNTFNLGSILSPFFGPAYYFDPLNSSVSTSFSNLYSSFGDVTYPFILQPNDKISIQAINKDGPTQEYTVDKVVFEGTQSIANIYIREDIDGYFNACDKFYQVIFLKRVEDETNIICNFKKPTGKTSYGFSIPQNISPSVIANIDTITRNVNQQLIDMGVSVTI